MAAGQAAAERGSSDEAIAAFETALTIEPENAAANNNLGNLWLAQGEPERALKFFQTAIQVEPSIKFVVDLGQCFETLNDAGSAIKCYRAALAKRSSDTELWIRLAGLLEIIGDRVNAEDAYASALAADPACHAATIGLAWLLWRTDTARAIHTVETALQRGDLSKQIQAKLLAVLLLFNEWSGRRNRGLPAYHATSINEMFFHEAASTLEKLRTISAELVEQDPTDDWAKMTEALATFATGDLEHAQEKFSAVGGETFSSMARAVRFDEEFFNGLKATADSKLLNGLPEVEFIKTCDFGAHNVLYMSCNSSYFDTYTKPLLRSLSHAGPGTQVHIHLMDSSEEHTEAARRFCCNLPNVHTALSVERPSLPENDPTAARSYFHAIRFIRFYHHLKQYNKTLWLMDVDALFNTSPQTFFATISESDVALRVRPGRLEPWNQFNACLLGVRPTSKGLNYLESVAAYIAYFYQQQNLPWGIDQLAMYACYVDLERHLASPKLQLINEHTLDYEHKPDGVLWCSSGSIKLTSLSRTMTADDPDASAYDKAYARFRLEEDNLDPSTK